MRIGFICSLFLALSCICANAQERCEVFTTQTENDIPYRIPAFAALNDGTLICVADYRFSRKDVGIQKDGIFSVPKVFQSVSANWSTEYSRINIRLAGECDLDCFMQGKRINISFFYPHSKHPFQCLCIIF